ncbi:MAG: gamma-glutamylcyclotransferase family protein [Solirubrobacterales bacterium]
MSRLALFAYGSLASPASATLTLGRPVELAGLARVEGWARGWSVCRDNLSVEKTFARPDGTLPRHCLGLGLEPDPGAEPPNGALIEVSEAELERLDLREMRYERVDVTDGVRVGGKDGAAAQFDRVVAYRARPEHRCPNTPPPDTVIIARYLTTIEAAFAELGPGELERFRATTEPPPVDLIDAVLVRDRIPAGNPRAW